MKIHFILFTLFVFLSQNFFSQNKSDTVFIKVHFLYGSKPKKKFRGEESKWFGGMLGGHVGIEKDSGNTFDFVPSGKFHVFAKTKNRHSKFTTHTISSFYSCLGSNADSVKKLCVVIPITKAQSLKLDSLSKIYLAQTPFDYAFFGMRCGAAAYYVLSQIGVVKKFGIRRTYLKIFYPKKLRKRLLRKAKKNNWKIISREGTTRRIWERD